MRVALGDLLLGDDEHASGIGKADGRTQSGDAAAYDEEVSLCRKLWQVSLSSREIMYTRIQRILAMSSDTGKRADFPSVYDLSFLSLLGFRFLHQLFKLVTVMLDYFQFLGRNLPVLRIRILAACFCCCEYFLGFV
ncbi:MAG TPA: hypothetical protein VFQ00_09900 [Terriglobales bacterium]|nr:hypothetical protein [Terriglobales bacterium]